MADFGTLVMVNCSEKMVLGICLDFFLEVINMTQGVNLQIIHYITSSCVEKRKLCCESMKSIYIYINIYTYIFKCIYRNNVINYF